MASKAPLVFVLLALLSIQAVLSKAVGGPSHAYLEQLQEKVVRMEKQMEDLRTQLSYKPEQELRHGIQVAFFATMTIQRKTYNAGDTVKFENVITNIGNDYNPSTGVYKVPASGTYFFQSSILSDNGAEVWTYMTVNGVNKSKLNARGVSGRHGSGTQALIMTLNQNDEVKMVNYGSNAKYYGGDYSSFAGYLL